MSTAVLTPYRRDLAKNLGGRLFRKQLLPVGTIDYKGRRLDFTRAYLADLANAFEAKAYDAVKFLLAPADNSHTLDPERMRGTLRGVELADDGLYGYLDLSDDAAALVTEHPDLGVSARIVEGLQRADGKTFPRAIQHVLGTLDPRVTGMKPWESVELSTDPQTTVVDLTAATYTHEEHPMPETQTPETPQGLSADELAQLRALLAAGGSGDGSGDSNDSSNELTPDVQAELDALIADAELTADTPALEGAALTAEAQAAIDLANANAEQAQTQVAELQNRLAAQQWAADRAGYANAGVPPAMLDLATPLLELPAPAVIELSNSARVDATDVVRKLLDAAKGYVDLSAEQGHQHDNVTDEAKAEEKALLDAWSARYDH